MPNKSKILTIVGPTASGKTGLAIEVAKQINGEVIGLDSRQIYRKMAIGTAQPTAEEQAGIRHHLIGFRSPKKEITAGEYAKLVIEAVKNIRERQKEPIICGGAGLYYRAITKGIFTGSVSNLEIRKSLENEYDELGGEILLSRLKNIDPEYAGIVHPNNKKRLVRALEIYKVTGKTPTDHFKAQDATPKLSLFTVFIKPDMDILEERIRIRTRQMLDDGWIEEVQSLMKDYSGIELHPLDSIGYRQIVDFINGGYTKEELIDEIVLRTRQYAKRQIQWFKNEPADLIIDSVSDPGESVKNIINSR